MTPSPRNDRTKPGGIGFSQLQTILLFIAVSAATSGCSQKSPEEVQREQLFQRFLTMMGTNVPAELNSPEARKMLRPMFDSFIVHPAFGLGWTEIPPPTLAGPDSMAAVSAFVATNGWQMATGNLSFTYFPMPTKPLVGLPWKEIHERTFPAITRDGILYVILSGWHHDCYGVAYNPNTNVFASGISGFRPLDSHWYAWVQVEFPGSSLEQRYEGARTNTAPSAQH